MQQDKAKANGTSKRPSFQFYPGDWKRHPQLMGCTHAARGLWIDMMCFMHDCTPYGHVSNNGKPVSDDRLYRTIGAGLDHSEFNALLSELEEAGIFTRLSSGTIVSNRMVRDGALSDERSKANALNGRKGGLAKQKASQNVAIATEGANEILANASNLASNYGGESVATGLAKSYPSARKTEDAVEAEIATEVQQERGTYNSMGDDPFDVQEGALLDAKLSAADADAYLLATGGV